VEPGPENGSSQACRLMIDKITTVRRSRLGDRVGELSDADVVRLNRAVVVFLGIASSG
ncbi:MAG: type II toxin-antitoxin system PemK/MazF family toxin, partial [Acidimicrobiales bacterium]